MSLNTCGNSCKTISEVTDECGKNTYWPTEVKGFIFEMCKCVFVCVKFECWVILMS